LTGVELSLFFATFFREMKNYTDICRLFLEKDYRVLRANPCVDQVPWAPPKDKEVYILQGGTRMSVKRILLYLEENDLIPNVLVEIESGSGEKSCGVAMDFQSLFDALTSPGVPETTLSTDSRQCAAVPSVPQRLDR